MKFSGVLAYAMSFAAPMACIVSVVTILQREAPDVGAVQNLKETASTYDNNFTLVLQKADRTERRSDALRANAEPVSWRDMVSDPVTIAARINYLAYAPAETDIQAPFNVLFGGADRAGGPLPMPRLRPDEIDTAKFMTGHGPQRRRPGDHGWAANKLAPHVYVAEQQDCLARGIYFESRGEPERGQAAVGQVILNRVKNPAYPSTICAVVYQNKDWHNRCQFSFACDGVSDRIRSTKRFKIAQRIARQVTDGELWLPEVGDATHFHTTDVSPKWAGTMKKTDQIGRHIFYRTRAGGLS